MRVVQLRVMVWQAMVTNAAAISQYTHNFHEHHGCSETFLLILSLNGVKVRARVVVPIQQPLTITLAAPSALNHTCTP